MEKGANSSSGFSVSDKKSSSKSDGEFGSSMKFEISTEEFPSKICMMGSNHHQHQGKNLDRPSAGTNDDDDGGGGGGGGVVGPTNNSSGANEAVGIIYASSRGGENFAKSTNNLQPFDIFPSYKSPAAGMAATVGFPFTSAQWKELERQAMIYKYMICSVPVPTDLLFPRNFPPDSSPSSIYNVRSSKNGDPEPGRCKRTDGKKWRCSREVAPHQKYCERHLHRGRPRSRKPVEVKNNGENHKKTRLEQSRSLPTVESDTTAEFVAANEPLLLFNAKTDLSISTPSYKRTTDRDLGLMMEAPMAGRDSAEQQPWQHLMEANMGLANDGISVYSSSGPIFHQDYVDRRHQPLNMFSYSNFPAPEIGAPTCFIDAWSIDNMNRTNNGDVESSKGDLSPSLDLSMAMAAGEVLDEEMRNMHHEAKVSTWLSPISWEPFARGGPLGEALQLGSLAVGASSNPASPYNSISSTLATTVSSPSGVLQRTMFSNSDGSVCNSPILAAATPSEVAIQWLN